MVIEVVKPDNKVNILVVEDNNYIRNLIVTLLVRQNYNIVAASNAFEALDLVMQYGAKFLDLIIVSHEVPDFNGVNFISEFQSKKEFQDIPVILLTQYSDQFFTKNDSDKNIEQIFDCSVHKTEIYKFLVQKVKILLNDK